MSSSTRYARRSGPIPVTVSDSEGSDVDEEFVDCDDEESFYDVGGSAEDAEGRVDGEESSFGTVPQEDSWEDAMFEDEDPTEQATRPTTCTTGIPFHSRLGRRIDFVQLTDPAKKTHLQKTFAYQLFGDRLVMYKMDMTKNQGNMPTRFQEEESDGYVYEILCSKFEKKTQDNIPKKTLTLYYVLTQGPGNLPAINLQHELDKVANWGRLPSQKVPARLELLFSTAVKGQRQGELAIYTDLKSHHDFELIAENSHVGCGFIPRQYIERFLGSKTVRGRRTFAIQVRIFSAQLGVFKGMLMEKPGIDKIQLPPSMLKVPPLATTATNDNTTASLLINNTYPSSVHTQVTKLLNGHQEPPVSFIPNKLKWMITSLLTSLGVSQESMDEYVEEAHSRHGRGLQHSCVVGVADPTNAIPPGHVFVTGVLGTNADLPELFVTRFPCTSPRDGLMLPLVQQSQMRREDWNFLDNLPFGAIIFGNAAGPGEPSLPSICAGGDLDGDNYFVCWNRSLLDQITTVEPAEGTWDDGAMDVRSHRNPQWLRDAQTTVANASRLAAIFDLIGTLCTARKNLVRDCGPDCPDAFSLGQAYKDSLDVAKHGRPIRLPRHLWDMLPETVHGMLTTAADHDCRCEFHNDPIRHRATQSKKKRTRTSTSHNSSRNDNNATASEQTANNNDHLGGLKEGAPVDIVGGTYKDKSATFVRLTAKMVYVKLPGPPPKEIRIAQKFIRPTS